MRNIVFKNVPETWEELKDFCFENYQDLTITDNSITDNGLYIDRDGTIMFYDNCITECSEIESICLFLKAVYGW